MVPSAWASAFCSTPASTSASRAPAGGLPRWWDRARGEFGVRGRPAGRGDGPEHAELIEGGPAFGQQRARTSGAVPDAAGVEGSLVGDEVAEVVALGFNEGDGDAEVAVAFAVSVAGGESVGEAGFMQVPDHAEFVQGLDDVGVDVAVCVAAAADLEGVAERVAVLGHVVAGNAEVPVVGAGVGDELLVGLVAGVPDHAEFFECVDPFLRELALGVGAAQHVDPAAERVAVAGPVGLGNGEMAVVVAVGADVGEGLLFGVPDHAEPVQGGDAVGRHPALAVVLAGIDDPLDQPVAAVGDVLGGDIEVIVLFAVGGGVAVSLPPEGGDLADHQQSYLGEQPVGGSGRELHGDLRREWRLRSRAGRAGPRCMAQPPASRLNRRCTLRTTTAPPIQGGRRRRSRPGRSSIGSTRGTVLF